MCSCCELQVSCVLGKESEIRDSWLTAYWLLFHSSVLLTSRTRTLSSHQSTKLNSSAEGSHCFISIAINLHQACIRKWGELFLSYSAYPWLTLMANKDYRNHYAGYQLIPTQGCLIKSGRVHIRSGSLGQRPIGIVMVSWWAPAQVSKWECHVSPARAKADFKEIWGRETL